MNFQKWVSNIQSQLWKQKLSLIFLQVMNIKANWANHFQKSISLWIQYIFLKIQSQYNNHRAKINVEASKQYEAIQIEKKIIVLLSETQQCVIKSLINIQKLYLIPQARQKKLITYKQNVFEETLNVFNIESKPKSMTKTRSSSLTNNRKPHLFNTGIKPNKQSSYITTSAIPTIENYYKYAKTTSAITKNFRGRPKYPKNQSLTYQQCNLPINTMSNLKKNTVENQLHSSLIEHLQQKQIDQTKLITRVEQKMRNIQYNINQKLNTIMGNLMKCQIEKQKKEENDKGEIKNQQSEQASNNGGQIVERNEKEVCKQSKRKSNSIKKYIKNEIFAEQSEVPEIIGNEQSQKKTKIVENAEKCFSEFVTQTKKVKLPINEQFTGIFYNCYKNLCKKYQVEEKKQKLGMSQEKMFAEMEINSCKKQYKQCLIKLKKLLTIDTIKEGLAQKIQIYIQSAIRCGYNLILYQDNYEIKDDPSTQINKITINL